MVNKLIHGAPRGGRLLQGPAAGALEGGRGEDKQISPITFFWSLQRPSATRLEALHYLCTLFVWLIETVSTTDGGDYVQQHPD